MPAAGQLTVNFTGTSNSFVSAGGQAKTALKEIREEIGLLSDAQWKLRQSTQQGLTGKAFTPFADPAIQRNMDQAVSRQAAHIQQMRRMNRMLHEEMAGGVAGGAGSSRRGVQGLLELSRGAEDAAVSYGLNGLTGALRGSINNISQFAMITGGPAVAALAGFAGAGVSLALPFLEKLIAKLTGADEAAKQLANTLERMDTEKILEEIGKQRTFSKSLRPKGNADSIFNQVTENFEALRESESDLKLAEAKLRTSRADKAFGLIDVPDEVIEKNIKEVERLEREVNLRRRADVDLLRAHEKAMVKEGTEEAVKAANELAAEQRKLIQEGTDVSNQARNELAEEDRKRIREGTEESNKARNELAEEARTKRKAMAERILNGLTKGGDQTLSASLFGSTAETSSIARATRMASKSDPTEKQIEEAVKKALEEHKKHTTQNKQIQAAIEKIAPVYGVTF